MWLVTEIGFFSIVQKPEDRGKGLLTVRSRVKSDLEALAQKHLPLVGPIQESTSTDYRFRAKAKQADVAAAMARLAASIDYPNFKDRVTETQGWERHTLYGKVWTVLNTLQSKADIAPPKPAAHVARPVAAQKTSGLKQAAGGVLVDAEGRVLLREPKGHYDHYVWTFAKGKVDPGETPEQAALREVREETGYAAEIVGLVPGTYEGGTSINIYFLMRPVGVQGSFDRTETSSTRWVTWDEARQLIGKTTNEKGRERDLAVLEAARKMAGA